MTIIKHLTPILGTNVTKKLLRNKNLELYYGMKLTEK